MPPIRAPLRVAANRALANLVRRHEAIASRASLGAKSSSPLDFARLFVELANPHFFLDAAPLDQFPKAADGLLGRFFVSQRQLNHTHS